MTLEEFIALAGEHNVQLNTNPPSFCSYGYRSKAAKDTAYLTAEWSTGGTGGGSCWDEDHHYSTEGDVPAELTFLDELLELVKPDIGLLQYRTLCNAVVHHDTYSESGYYGNSTNYAVKYVRLEELYDYMVGKGWIS